MMQNEMPSGRASKSDECQTVAARETPFSEIVDMASGVLTKAADRIDQLVESVNALHAERNRLRKINADLIAMLETVSEELDDREDVVDGPEGQPRANWAMSLNREVKETIEAAQRA